MANNENGNTIGGEKRTKNNNNTKTNKTKNKKKKKLQARKQS